jgi:hypothetical protein
MHDQGTAADTGTLQRIHDTVPSPADLIVELTGIVRALERTPFCNGHCDPAMTVDCLELDIEARTIIGDVRGDIWALGSSVCGPVAGGEDRMIPQPIGTGAWAQAAADRLAEIAWSLGPGHGVSRHAERAAQRIHQLLRRPGLVSGAA